MFELKQLQCFVAVGEELHFGRAAKRLHMTQPPLSRQIQMLEHELRTQLLSRTSRSVRLTPAGRAFLEKARHLLALASHSMADVQRISRGDTGLIRMGFTAGSSYRHLPKILTKASAVLKDVTIVLQEMVTLEQMEALRFNKLDFGLLRLPVDQKGIQVACIAREPLLLAVPRGHRLASGRTPKVTDLDTEPFITFSPTDGRYFYELIDELFRSSSVDPQYVQHVSQIHSILALVSAGMGIALVPQSSQALHFDGVVLRKLQGKSTFVELYLAWRDENENPAVPRFRDLMNKHFVLPAHP